MLIEITVSSDERVMFETRSVIAPTLSIAMDEILKRVQSTYPEEALFVSKALIIEREDPLIID